MRRALVLFIIVLLLSSSFLAQAREEGLKDLQKQVQQEFQRNNYKKVIKIYQDYVASHSDPYVPLSVRIAYSQSLADTGEIGEAIETLQALLQDLPVDSNSLKLQYDLANLFFIERRYDEARVVYQKILLQSSRYHEIFGRTQERMNLLKEKEGRKKDVISLQLLEIETVLEGGEVPEGSLGILEKIRDQKPPSSQAGYAKRLIEKLQEVRTNRAKALLDEARRLYDEKKYADVQEVIDQITRDYQDVCDQKSVETLQKETNRRLGKTLKF